MRVAAGAGPVGARIHRPQPGRRRRRRDALAAAAAGSRARVAVGGGGLQLAEKLLDLGSHVGGLLHQLQGAAGVRDFLPPLEPLRRWEGR